MQIKVWFGGECNVKNSIVLSKKFLINIKKDQLLIDKIIANKFIYLC